MPLVRRTAGALLAAAALTGCAATASTPPAPAAAFHGNEPAQELSRPSFVLTTAEGERYDFAERTRGRPTLLYFGYTSCPDECPTAMADITAALRTTPAELREQVVVVFVTTDPARDSPAALRRWVDRFSPEYVALRGTQQEVDAAQEAAGVPAAPKGGPVPTLPGRPNEHEHQLGTAPHSHDGPLGYGVAHADVIFAFDTRDRLPVLYEGGVRPADLAADLPLLAQTQGDAP